MSGETQALDCRCNGTGQLVYRIPAEEPRKLPDGTIIQAMGGSGSRPCPCRQALAPRDGEAAWWDQEQVFYEAVEVCGEIGLEITVMAEVPYSRDNYRVHRRGNRYYPTTVDVVWDDPIVIHPDDAERIAAAFKRAAEACRKVDAPDEADCGHWWPCSHCETASPSPSEGTE